MGACRKIDQTASQEGALAEGEHLLPFSIHQHQLVLVGVNQNIKAKGEQARPFDRDAMQGIQTRKGPERERNLIRAWVEIPGTVKIGIRRIDQTTLIVEQRSAIFWMIDVNEERAGSKKQTETKQREKADGRFHERTPSADI